MKKEYVVKLDVYLGVLEARVISFNQLNTGTCKLSFELTSNKQALDLTGQKVTFEVTTPGGATLEDAILVTDATQGKCECTLANDMIAEQGLHCGEINVYSADHAKTLTFKKIMYLVNGQLGAKDITVDTRYSTLQELIFDVENLKNKYVIDTEAVTQMKNETDLMHKDVIAKHGDVEVKHQEVVTLSQSVKDDASRTASNAQQVSTDKGIVTKAKNEVVAKHEEVLRTVAGIAQDKAIVEQAKTEIVGYKNEVEAMKNDVQQLVTDSTEDLILEGNRQVVRVSTEGTTQVNLAKEEVNKATQQATVATEQASLAKTEADKVSGALERLDVKNTEQDNRLTALENNPASNVTLNGEAQTNFNFIGDENSTISALQIGEKTYSFNGGSSSGTTTDNVVDRAGRTQEQINRTFYKRMCKEIPSPSGEPITVENGEEGYVLSAEIKGQTVKNYLYVEKDLTGATGIWQKIFEGDISLQATKTYTFYSSKPIFWAIGFTYTDGTEKYESLRAVEGNSVVLTLTKDVKTVRIYNAKDYTGDYIVTVNIVEGNLIPKQPIPFGLSSTQAIIENNGQQYPIYANEEDKANKKVISLPFAEDKIELKDDGNVVWTDANDEIILATGTISDGSVLNNIFFATIPISNLKVNTNGTTIKIYCDKFNEIAFNNRDSIKVGDIWQSGTSKNIYVAIKEGVRPTQEEADAFLNGAKVKYLVETPTITLIDKSLVPTILTNKTNILDVGGAVKPSSFKVTVPVDRIAELTARLEALEAKTNTQPVNTAFVDETYAKSVNKIEEVIK